LKEKTRETKARNLMGVYVTHKGKSVRL